MSPDPRPLRMELGGLGFVVRCGAAPVAADLDPPYTPFLSRVADRPETRADSPGDETEGLSGRSRIRLGARPRDVVVDVLLESPPPADTSPLFETGHAWTMRARGDDRLFFHQGPRRDAPLWTAGFPVGVERVTVWCDPREWGPAADGRGVPSPLRYPLDQVLAMYALARHGGLLLHATGVVIDGRALACCGVSGAGKSTLARLLAGAGVGDLLSDDRVILRRDPSAGDAAGSAGLRAYGTPWPGDARVAVNESAPLGALVFLRHAPRDRVTPLSPAAALHRLLPVASIPWFDAAVVPSALAACEDVVRAAPAYELEFRPEPAVAEAVGGIARAWAGVPA